MLSKFNIGNLNRDSYLPKRAPYIYLFGISFISYFYHEFIYYVHFPIESRNHDWGGLIHLDYRLIGATLVFLITYFFGTITLIFFSFRKGFFSSTIKKPQFILGWIMALLCTGILIFT